MENYAGLSGYTQYNYKGHNERKRRGGVDKWCDYESTHEWCFVRRRLCVCVCVCVCVSHSVVSDSLRLHGLYPVRLLCPWNSPGKNTGVGCHYPPQGRRRLYSKKRVVSRYWKRQINVFCLRASKRNIPQHTEVSLQRCILDCWISEL